MKTGRIRLVVHPTMSADLTHLSSQQELDGYLNRKYRLPVEVSALAPLPTTKPYKPLLKLQKSGVTFLLRELLHVVGNKAAALPYSSTDACIRSARILFDSFDLTQKDLAFRKDIPSDFQTSRSQEVGVGVSCLIASKYLNIPIDSFEPIPKVGMRFDYHGQRDGLSWMLESKGTKYRSNQTSQIKHGIAKKEAHHEDGEFFDVELISSTCVGIGKQKPRILLGDPRTVTGDWLRSEQARKFFRIRHYVRVLQFIGDTALARALYLESIELKDLGMQRLDRRRYQTLTTPQDIVRVAGVDYVGSYYYSALPERSERYAHRRLRDLRRDIDPRIRLFQGLRADRYDSIRSQGADALTLEPIRVARQRTDNGSEASIYEDGSILFFQLTV